MNAEPEAATPERLVPVPFVEVLHDNNDDGDNNMSLCSSSPVRRSPRIAIKNGFAPPMESVSLVPVSPKRSPRAAKPRSESIAKPKTASPTRKRARVSIKRRRGGVRRSIPGWSSAVLKDDQVRTTKALYEAAVGLARRRGSDDPSRTSLYSGVLGSIPQHTNDALYTARFCLRGAFTFAKQAVGKVLQTLGIRNSFSTKKLELIQSFQGGRDASKPVNGVDVVFSFDTTGSMNRLYPLFRSLLHVQLDSAICKLE